MGGSNPISQIASAAGNVVGDTVNGRLSRIVPDATSPITGQPNAPAAPTNDPNSPLSTLQTQQQQYANQFSQDLPSMKNQNASNLSSSASMTNNQQNKAINRGNSARGLGYGGVNQGMQAKNSANNAGLLANNIEQSNASFDNAANTLNTQALETGVGIQQQQQQIQNQIYSQAMANQNASNQMTSSAIGTGLLLALI